MKMLANMKLPATRSFMLGTMVLMVMVGALLVMNYRAATAQHHELQQAQREKAALKEELSQIQKQSGDMAEQTKRLQEQVDAMTKEKSDLQAQLQDAQKQLDDLKKVKQALHLSALSTESDRKAIVGDTQPSSWVSFQVTAYSAYCNTGCRGITRTGYDVRDNSIDHRVVAVDPSIIPLYSIVEIEGLGYFKAIDTGGAIVGRHVDVLVSTRSEENAFGTQTRKVRIVRRGAGGGNIL